MSRHAPKQFGYKDWRNDPRISGTTRIFFDPYEKNYDPVKALEANNKLAAKYPVSPHRVVPDFIAVAKIRLEMKNGKKYDAGTIWM